MNQIIQYKAIATVAVWVSSVLMHKHQTDAIQAYHKTYAKDYPHGPNLHQIPTTNGYLIGPIIATMLIW